MSAAWFPRDMSSPLLIAISAAAFRAASLPFANQTLCVETLQLIVRVKSMTESLLNTSGASLIYAVYRYDPCA